jgi:hypothetical protein
MNRRTKVILLVGGLVFATVVVLSLALAPSLSLALTLSQGLGHNRCEIGFRNLIIGCHVRASSRITFQSTPDPAFAAPSTSTTIPQASPDTAPKPGLIEQTSWDITEHCTLGNIASRLLCASLAAPARDDLKVELSEATGLPLPRGRVLTTEENSLFIKSVHVEMPLNLAAVLGFYRVELSKRGWTENDGAVVAPDRAVIAFATSDGPALLRLIRQDDRTIADLSLRKPGAVAKADILPNPGQVKLRLGNETDEEAVITINEQTIKLAARAKLPDSPQIDLPPGKFKVTLKVPGSAAQNREFEVGADETWNLLVGPAGVPLPVQIY